MRTQKMSSPGRAEREHEKRLQHASGEYRRSLIRNMRQKNMQQYVNQLEQPLSTIPQVLPDEEGGQDGGSSRTRDSTVQLDPSVKGRSNDRHNGKVKQSKADKKGQEEAKKKAAKRRLIFNTFNTNYPVIDLAAKNLGFKTVYKDHNLVPGAEVKAANRLAPGIYANIMPEEFDVAWFDLPVKEEVLQKLKPHQRISQWPGIQVLSNKSRLAKNLTAMQKTFADSYRFFPESFVLPQDLPEFKRKLQRTRQSFIVKPSHDCQGRGIYIVNSWDEYRDDDGKQQVAQAYVDNPLLLDQLKFDVRLYVLISGIHPLRIYLFDEGLARFATAPYESASSGGDTKNLFMHLTNYAINKHSKAYV